jgi:DNA repair protein RadC
MTIRISSAQKKILIKGASQIVAILQDILRQKRSLRQHFENLWIVGLNNENKLQFIEITAVGRFKVNNTSPVEIFRRALEKNATKLALVQYSPKGNLMPMPDDKSTAERMVKAGELLGMAVFDYIIISASEYLSFAEEGVVEELNAVHKKQPKTKQQKRRTHQYPKGTIKHTEIILRQPK